MTTLVDASGVALALPHPPRRIVSLIPSTTETLCALGLADALVGITVYCREPAAVTRTKTRIGGEKDPDLDSLRGDKEFSDLLEAWKPPKPTGCGPWEKASHAGLLSHGPQPVGLGGKPA